LALYPVSDRLLITVYVVHAVFGLVQMLEVSDNQCMQHAIVRDPEVLHGTPVFRGTRVPVQTLFDNIEGGETLGEFLTGFPTVTRALALESLEEAKQLLLARS
jgi:uncharacterized protein (DUF433 family)